MPADRRPAALAVVRLWLAERGDAVVLALGAAAFVGLAAPFVLPTGPSEALVGRVVGLGATQTETGAYARAVVRLSDRTVSVRLPRGHVCAKGDAIRIVRKPRLLRTRYGAALPPCRDSRPISGSPASIIAQAGPGGEVTPPPG